MEPWRLGDLWALGDASQGWWQPLFIEEGERMPRHRSVCSIPLHPRMNQPYNQLRWTIVVKLSYGKHGQVGGESTDLESHKVGVSWPPHSEVGPAWASRRCPQLSCEVALTVGNILSRCLLPCGPMDPCEMILHRWMEIHFDLRVEVDSRGHHMDHAWSSAQVRPTSWGSSWALFCVFLKSQAKSTSETNYW